MKWIKELLWIVNNWELTNERINNALRASADARQVADNAVEIIRERTEVHLDHHMHSRSQSQIIVIGRYRKKDYINIFSIPDRDITALVAQLKSQEKFGKMGVIDTMPNCRGFITDMLR